jgi:hypothetical protein
MHKVLEAVFERHSNIVLVVELSRILKEFVI